MVQMERSSSRGPVLEGLSLRPEPVRLLLQLTCFGAAWIGDKIWKPQVKKVGIETLEEV